MSDETEKKKDSDEDAPTAGPDAETGADDAPSSKPDVEEAAADKSESEEDGDDAADKPAEGRRRARRKPSREREDAAVEPAEAAPVYKPNYIFLIVASAIFLAMDLGSKWVAVKNLSDGPNETYVVVKGFWNFNLAQNKGGAWGLLGDQPDHVRLPFFFLISAVAVVFIVSLYRKLEPRQTALKWALPLVLGGALGNLVDRVRHQYVVDFIDWYVVMDGKESHWPTFNVADVWIVAGVGLMIIDMFTPRKAVRKPVARNVVKVAPKLTPKPKPADEEAEGA